MVFRLCLISACLLAGINAVCAQGYYGVRNDGAVPKGYYLDKVYDSDKTIHLNQPLNQELSEVGLIPFNFYFYGSSVNKFKVSDNGYLSFDISSSSSVVPDTTLPANSIVAFGKDFKLQKLPVPNDGIGTQVFSYTLGQAPNRRHIIQYYGLSLANDLLDKPISNASIYAFAIVLHEGPDGRFDLVYSPYGDKNIKGAIGCASAGSVQQTLMNDSLSLLPFQFSFDPARFIVYQFRYGIQPEYDLVIKDLKLSNIYPVNAIVNFTGTMSNWGKQAVHSYYLNYSVDAGDTVKHLIDQVNLLPNGQGGMAFSHPVSWVGGVAGSLNDVHFWLSEPDNDTDGISENSHITRIVLRNNNNSIVERNLLLEEGTGAWCGYCPDAHLLLSKAVQLHGNRVIPVSYHFDDSMSNPDGDEFLSRYISSYPDAQIDRKIFLGSNSTWLAEIAARLNINAPVSLAIEMKSYDLQTRIVRYRVRVRFTDYWYGDMRIGSLVTEQSVRGNASANIWSQNNYYSRFHTSGGAGGASHPLYNELEYMDGYLHQSVHKASPGGVWGTTGIVPALVAPGSEYTADFTYQLPPAAFVQYAADNNTAYCNTADGPGENEGRNIPARLQLVGFVSEYSDDYFNRPVLNAVSAPLWDLSNLQDLHNPENLLSVYPNPAAAHATLMFKLPAGTRVNLDVVGSDARLLSSEPHGYMDAGAHLLFLDTQSLANGIYQIGLRTDYGVYYVRLVINK